VSKALSEAKEDQVAETTYRGGCACGAVRYTIKGEPMVVGLCHCADCRKETGSAFLHYADWPVAAFSVEGRYATYEGRSFCPTCGSRLFHLNERHAEVVLGSLDAAPSGLVPVREGWVKRREPWLQAIPGAGQFNADPV
jgi:hypothetical protein